uniref:Small ribosomal subunit protein eS21 n=1 Tax=Leptobrachium leishanense TaxID=445787 RepID=A0A8C5QT02_9ANUR
MGTVVPIYQEGQVCCPTVPLPFTYQLTSCELYDSVQKLFTFFFFFSPSSASNRIICAKDHASIQMNVAEVDKVTGRFNGQFKTYAICGTIRRMGESDDSILRLAKNDSIVSKTPLRLTAT